MRGALVAFAALLFTLPAHAGYPEDVRQAFLASCEPGGEPELCRCVLTQLETEVSLEDLAAQRFTQEQLERMTYACAGVAVTQPATSCATALMCKAGLFQAPACDATLPEDSAARLDALLTCVADIEGSGCALADVPCLRRACKDTLTACFEDTASCSKPCDDDLLCIDGVCLACDDDDCQLPKE